MEHAALKCLDVAWPLVLEYSYQHGGIEVMHESSVGLGALPLGGLAPSAVWFLNQNKSKSDYTTDIKQQQNLLNQLFCNKPCTLLLQQSVNVLNVCVYLFLVLQCWLHWLFLINKVSK